MTTYVTVTGTMLAPDNDPITSGQMWFAPDATAIYTDTGVQVQRRYEFDIAEDGTFTAEIPATDTGNPLNWTYTVTEHFRGGRTYHTFAPIANMPGPGWDIAQLAPVPSNEGVPIVVGPAGPAGPAGNQIAPFRQASPAATWTAIHNLGTNPAVTLFADDDPLHPTYTEVDYPDLNTVIVVWPAPTSGWIYFG